MLTVEPRTERTPAAMASATSAAAEVPLKESGATTMVRGPRPAEGNPWSPSRGFPERSSANSVRVFGDPISDTYPAPPQASGFTGCGGHTPPTMAAAFRAHRRAISDRTDTVALPMWGSSTVFGSSTKPGASAGSCS